MYEHRKAASWSDTPIPVTPSQRAKPGRSGRNVFSQFLSPSVPKQPMHILPKALTSTLYDDPAFSADPHAHPFFATTSTPWAAAPLQAHSTLKGETRPPPLIFSTRIQDIEEFQLLQAPHTQMFSDDHSSTTHETNSSSNHTSTTSTSLSSPPTSSDSHSSPWAPLPSEKASPPLPWPPETQKKKKNITMFWRRTPPETVLVSVDIGRNAPIDPSPSPQMTPAPRPTPPRNATAPETIKSANRPILPPRPVTTAVDSKPPPTSSRRIIGGRAIRAHELDRIDELDESSPLGPLHHRGPYEAAQKSTTQESNEESPPNIGSQYQLTASSPIPKSKQKSHRHHLPEMMSIPIVPAGVSLNLSPGQILPRNFYHPVAQNAVSAPGLSDAPEWPPRHRPPYPDAHLNPYQSDESYRQQMSNLSVLSDLKPTHLDGRHRSAPPEYSVIPIDGSTTKRDHRVVPSQSPSFSHSPQDMLPGYDLLRGADDPKRSNWHSTMEFQLHSGPLNNHIQSPPDHRMPIPGHRHNQNNPRLPPRMQALQMQNGRPDEAHRRSPRPYNGTQENGPISLDNIPVQTSHRRRSQMSGQAPYALQVEPDQLPLFVDNNGFPASGPVPPSFEIPTSLQDQLQRSAIPQQEQDSRSSQRSITSSSRSTNSGNSRTLPPPNHLPKRLVMPAPLQASQPTAPRHQPSHAQAFRHPESHIWQPQLRPPSPTTVPTALDGQSLQAQDIQISQSRKLRKRSSIQGLSVPLVSPSQPLSFEPTTMYTDMLPPQHALLAHKPEKIPKRVLSKRRTDF